jgi:hypothetical protein
LTLTLSELHLFLEGSALVGKVALNPPIFDPFARKTLDRRIAR